jgi:hypothetical protein
MIDYTYPIRGLDGSSVSSSSKGGYTKNAAIINGRTNSIHKFILGQEFGFSYDYDAKFTLDLSAGLSNNVLKYNVDKEHNTNYVIQNYSIQTEYAIVESLIVSSILDYNLYAGHNPQPARKNLMWNASITKQVMKSNRGEITLYCSNILNQKSNVLTAAYDNLIEDSYTLNQGRLVVIQFRYNFQKLYGNERRD